MDMTWTDRILEGAKRLTEDLAAWKYWPSGKDLSPTSDVNAIVGNPPDPVELLLCPFDVLRDQHEQFRRRKNNVDYELGKLLAIAGQSARIRIDIYTMMITIDQNEYKIDNPDAIRFYKVLWDSYPDFVSGPETYRRAIKSESKDSASTVNRAFKGLPAEVRATIHTRGMLGRRIELRPLD